MIVFKQLNVNYSPSEYIKILLVWLSCFSYIAKISGWSKAYPRNESQREQKRIFFVYIKNHFPWLYQWINCGFRQVDWS